MENKTSLDAPQSRELGAHEPKQRPPRVALAGGSKLTFPNYRRNNELFHYHVFADTNGRIMEAESAWYEQCTYDDGTPCVMFNHGVKHHLMRLPIEEHKKDELDKEIARRATLKSKSSVNAENGEYIPDGARGSLTSEDPMDPSL